MILAWLLHRRTRQATRPSSFYDASRWLGQRLRRRDPTRRARSRRLRPAQLATKTAVAVASLSERREDRQGVHGEVRDDEGVASHIEPEPCVGIREGVRRSVGRETYRLSIELRKVASLRSADGMLRTGRQHVRSRHRK